MQSVGVGKASTEKGKSRRKRKTARNLRQSPSNAAEISKIEENSSSRNNGGGSNSNSGSSGDEHDMLFTDDDNDDDDDDDDVFEEDESILVLEDSDETAKMSFGAQVCDKHEQ